MTGMTTKTAIHMTMTSKDNQKAGKVPETVLKRFEMVGKQLNTVQNRSENFRLALRLNFFEIPKILNNLPKGARG